eukprot:TRINITY_DN18132_c0_g1_i1.p1 TRINITY_DN18132_c0_g1~~TRINITY_DN18132_c0_g1_i1.p1  ORF type:complete len:473 (-),score=90.95 TRINITY_DN18132_c0_g1_i1:131-1549(-)
MAGLIKHKNESGAEDLFERTGILHKKIIPASDSIKEGFVLTGRHDLIPKIRKLVLRADRLVLLHVKRETVKNTVLLNLMEGIGTYKDSAPACFVLKYKTKHRHKTLIIEARNPIEADSWISAIKKALGVAWKGCMESDDSDFSPAPNPAVTKHKRRNSDPPTPQPTRKGKGHTERKTVSRNNQLTRQYSNQSDVNLTQQTATNTGGAQDLWLPSIHVEQPTPDQVSIHFSPRNTSQQQYQQPNPIQLSPRNQEQLQFAPTNQVPLQASPRNVNQESLQFPVPNQVQYSPRNVTEQIFQSPVNVNQQPAISPRNPAEQTFQPSPLNLNQQSPRNVEEKPFVPPLQFNQQPTFGAQTQLTPNFGQQQQHQQPLISPRIPELFLCGSVGVLPQGYVLEKEIGFVSATVVSGQILQDQSLLDVHIDSLRELAQNKLIAIAKYKGANALLGLSFDISVQVTGVFIILAHGTACFVTA